MRAAVSVLVTVSVLLGAGLVCHGQGPTTSLPCVEQLMSAREFAAAGLQKLSAEELDALNRWLQKYTLEVAKAIASLDTTGETEARPTGQVIESRIDGEFKGWDGNTIFKLQNGQIWQQASYAYMYRYAYSPRVLIYRSGGVYKMRVDGTDREIAVRRLK